VHAAVVVPGIMGSELVWGKAQGNNEKIWPPTPLETQFGYKRIAKLRSDDIEPGEVINKVLCFDVYQPLTELLEKQGFKEGSVKKRLAPFPYDWRRDLFTTSDELAKTMGDLYAKGATKISLIAHSMGGLICRLMLERDNYRSTPWFRSIDLLATVATPHLGAPLALSRVLGLEGSLGISGNDWRSLANMIKYPAAYQLLPPPGEAVCWDQNDQHLAALDIYSPEIADALGLNRNLLERTRALHDVLGLHSKPEHVKYFYFSATGHRTATRINVQRQANGSIPIEQVTTTLTADGGDGTVPIYSALPRMGQRQVVTNDHGGAFRGMPFKRVLVRLLGGNEGDAVELDANKIFVAISLEASVIEPGRDIEVLLFRLHASDEEPLHLDSVNGHFVVTRTRQGEATVSQEVARHEISYRGPATPQLRAHLPGISEPGVYSVQYVGAEATSREETFAICRYVEG
jgi:phospholipase A1